MSTAGPAALCPSLSHHLPSSPWSSSRDAVLVRGRRAQPEREVAKLSFHRGIRSFLPERTRVPGASQETPSWAPEAPTGWERKSTYLEVGGPRPLGGTSADIFGGHTGGGCCWHLVGRGQGRHRPSHSAQDITGPKGP